MSTSGPWWAARSAAKISCWLPADTDALRPWEVGTLVVLAWQRRAPAGRAVLVAAATLWVGAGGLTRIYLGVHWFSDVVAGWLVGGAWLALCVAAWSWWRARTTSAP